MYKTMLVAMLLVASLAAAGPIEIPLINQTDMVDSEQILTPYGSNFTPVYGKVPSNVKAPADLPPGFMFGTVKLGDSAFPFVLTSNTEGKFDKLLFDQNANGDLTDEQGTTSDVQNMDTGGYTVYWPLSLKYKIGDKEYPYQGMLSFLSWLQNTDDSAAGELGSVLWKCNNFYRGAFKIGDKEYLVRLADLDADGVFGEKAKPVDDEQKLSFSADRLFVLPASTNKPAAAWHWSDYLAVEGTLYKVQLLFPESKLVLTPVEGPLEKMQLPVETEQLQIWDEQNQQMLSFFQPSKEIPLPTGKYRLVNYLLARKDEKDLLPWVIQAAAAKDIPIFGPGGDPLVYGEPFQPHVSIPPFSLQMFEQDPSSLQLSFELKGAAGEVVFDLKRFAVKPGLTSVYKANIAMSAKNSALPEEPMYRLVTADGEVVSQGAFEYG